VMVPPQAIQEDQLGKFVYTVDANNTAKRTSVKIGMSTRLYSNISKGLNDGDRVVISGLLKTKEGRLLAPKDMTDTQGTVAVMKKNNLILKETSEKSTKDTNETIEEERTKEDHK